MHERGTGVIVIDLDVRAIGNGSTGRHSALAQFPTACGRLYGDTLSAGHEGHRAMGMVMLPTVRFSVFGIAQLLLSLDELLVRSLEVV